MFINQTKNRSHEHLSASDRLHENDNGYHEKHETHQEQDQNIQPLMDFTDTDKIFNNNNESTGQVNITIRNNKYLTSDFDIKRDSKKSGLIKYPWINRTDKSEIELNMESCSKRVCVHNFTFYLFTVLNSSFHLYTCENLHCIFCNLIEIDVFSLVCKHVKITLAQKSSFKLLHQKFGVI